MTPGIILVCGQYPTATRWGGIGTYTRHHAHALQAAGVPVTVLAGASDDAPRIDDDHGIPVFRVVPGTGGDAGLDRQALSESLRTLIAETGAGIVEGAEYCAPLLEFQRSCPDVPVVIRLHGAATLIRDAAQPAWRSTIARRTSAARRLTAEERESVERASLVSSPSAWTLDVLRARGWRIPDSAIVVANPMPAIAATLRPTRDRALNSVCVLGRLDRLKGADLLPDVMRAVWARRPETEFVSVGQDTPRSTDESWGEWIVRRIPAEHRHRFVQRGGMSPDAVSALLATQRIAVFASVFETFSYTTVECMSHGLACVVASDGGPRELGQHGTHLMLAQRRPEAIADTLVQLLTQPGTVTALGEAAQRHARSAFEPAALTTRVLTAYGALLPAERLRRTA